MACVAAGACRHSQQTVPAGALQQRGYLWQREWTPAVVDALVEARKHTDGVVLLGVEILWQGGIAHPVMATIPWDALRREGKPCAIAVRIAPWGMPGSDAQGDKIVEVTKSLLDTARSHGVQVEELQVDFDCPQSGLAGYGYWLRRLAPVVHPARLVITTLPAWLNEPEFPKLLGDVDGWVLQVHSVPTRRESGRVALCDPALARKWVAKASALGKPFSVALPTYWCLAGYDASGKLLGVAMDSVQPAWPAGTRVLEFGTDADEMAGLVKEWQALAPPGMLGLIWYRLPVSSDQRNWRWLTLAAVMAGRKPAHKLEAVCEGENPYDISVVNDGEAEERLDCDVVATSPDGTLMAADSLQGWSVARKKSLAIFTATPEYAPGLSPGVKRSIGWIRYETNTPPRLQLVEHGAASR